MRPERNAQAHAARLLQNLSDVEVQLRQIDEAIERAPAAEGHLVAADGLEGATLPAASLGDRRAAIAVVAEGDERAVLHVRRDDLGPLRGKITRYGDPERSTRTGRPFNEPLVGALEGFRLASLADLSDGRLTEANVEHGRTYWVELWTRGGSLEEPETRERILREIRWLAARVGVAPDRVRPFRATERDVYLLPLPGEVLHAIPSLVPEVYRVVEATRPLRDLIVSEQQAELVVPENAVPPDDAAVAVVILDTGIAPEHPLLAPALRSVGVSSVVGDPSPLDTHGHGTEMAGLAAYADLGAMLLTGGDVRPRVGLVNSRLLTGAETTDDDREFWPERTEAAVLAAEAEDERARVFNLSVGAEHPDPGTRTAWSVGLDLLAYDDANGRLVCVATGNVDVSPARDDYPALNLVSFIDDPAQALNPVTVGAITHQAVLPQDALHGDLEPIAAEGELSPFSRTGIAQAPIKPEIVFEGGSCAPDGVLPNVGLDTLSVLTTDRRHADGRLLSYAWATSAACAAVSGLAGAIWGANRELRPETIRALLVHSARWPDALQAQFPDRRDLVRSAGYGEPTQELAAYSFRTRPTVVVEDALRPAVVGADGRTRRELHLVHLPLPSDELIELGEHEVELSVTLSFFAEPNEANRRNYAGAMLRWDVQRAAEADDEFRQRVNRLERERDFVPSANPYPWDIGADVRSRGTVQSDRCRVTAASLAGGKQIAVFPVLGWWDGRSERAESAVNYALAVTVDAGQADIDLYAEVEAAITVPIEVQDA